MFEKDKYPQKTGLKCPITGSELLFLGGDREVRDPDSFYSPESDESIIFARHPFSYNIFRLVEQKSMGEKGLRFFKLEKDKTWTEYKKIPYTNKLVKMDYPEDKFQEESKIAREKYQEQQKRLDKYRTTFKPISAELVKVQSLPPPLGKLNYIDFKYKDNDKK